MKEPQQYSKQTQRIAIAATVYCVVSVIREIILGVRYTNQGYEKYFLTSSMWNIVDYLMAIPFLVGVKMRPGLRAVSLAFCAFVLYSGIWIPINFLIRPLRDDLWIEMVARAIGSVLIFITIRRKWPYKERGIF